MTSPAAAARPPAPRTARGPAALTTAGAVLLLAAAVVGALVARGMAGMLPTDLLQADGGPGSGVVAVVDAPGAAEVELAANTDYAVYLAVEGPGPGAELSDAVRVEGPDGRVRQASDSAEVSVSTARGPTSAWTVGAFGTTAAGTYTLTAPGLVGGGDAQVLIAPDQPVLPFVAGVFGTVLGVFVAIALALAGVPMTVMGVFWWRRRRAGLRDATAAAQGRPA